MLLKHTKQWLVSHPLLLHEKTELDIYPPSGWVIALWYSYLFLKNCRNVKSVQSASLLIPDCLLTQGQLQPDSLTAPN